LILIAAHHRGRGRGQRERAEGEMNVL